MALTADQEAVAAVDWGNGGGAEGERKIVYGPNSTFMLYIPVPHRYQAVDMPPRRQRMEPRVSPIPEEGVLIEVPETQSQTEVQIPIRTTSNRGPSSNQPSAIGTQSQTEVQIPIRTTSDRGLLRTNHPQ